MEEMDIDEVVDVPDTPEQLAAWAINGNRARHVIGNGLDRRMNFTALNLRNPVESELHGGSDPLGNSSTFLNARLFRRTTADDILKDEMQHSAGHQHMNKGKAPCTKFPSETLSCKKDEAVVDLIEQKKNEQILWNGFPSGPSNGYWPNEFKGRSLNISGSPSKTAYRQSTKEANDCVLKGANSVTDCGNGINIPGKSQLDAKNNVSAYPHQIASHKLTGKKKLVKNGCISPNNIAKMSADGLGNCSKGAEHNDTRSSILVGLPCPSDIGDLVAEDDTGKLKGKEVMTRCASKEDGDNAICVLSRNSTNHEEKINKTIGGGPDAYDGREILGAWRSTHIRSKKLHGSSSGGHPSRNGKCVLNENGNRNEERRTRVGIGNKASCYSPEVEGAVSFQNRTAQPLADVLGFASRPDHSYERHQQPSAQIKRQRKQGAAPIRPPSASYNSDVVFLGSSVDMSDLQSTADHSCPSLGVPDQIIEIDESPSGSLQNVSQDIGCTDSERSDARARQLEADEMLARELQEQLYQELPVYGSGEVDANIALMLQQQEDARQASSSRSQPDLRLRNSLTSRNRPQLRSNQNNQARRGNQARVPAPNRMAQLRRRFRNQSAASISRESIFPFPVQMDLDRRMDILEALEEAANDLSNTIRARNIAGVQRDFNENDYEMLLALDENNYQHGGASVSQINSLPQSTVQRDNFEENCAICLETPTTGDTIRHLPCLHKFHKDCIDPWLSRRTSCPVCKSSIS